MFSSSAPCKLTVKSTLLPPLLSSCANCCGTMSTYMCVTSFALPRDSKTRFTVFQGLQLVFNGQEVSDDQANQFKFCLNCGKSFEKLFKLYYEFLQNSAPGSYVQHLVSSRTTTATSFVEATSDVVSWNIKQEHEHIGDKVTNHFEDQALERLQVVTPSSSKLPQPKLTLANGLTIFENIPSFATNLGIVCSDVEVANAEILTHTAFKDKGDSDFEYLDIDYKICSTEFDSEGEFEMNQVKNQRKVKFDCPKCSTCCKTKYDLIKHKRKIHKDEDSLLPSRREGRLMLSEEDASLLVTTDYKCFNCKEVSFGSFKEWLLHHKETHEIDFGYGDVKLQEFIKPRYGRCRPCPICGKTTKNNSVLLTHIKAVHQKQRPFNCDICHKTFTTKVGLNVHFTAFHMEKKAQQFLCTLCGRGCKTKGGLETHEKTHTGEISKTFECEICHAMFATKNRLSKHQFVHTNERPYSCDRCGSSFKTSSQLKQHDQKIHHKKNIIDQFCEICGRGYAFKNKLKEHLMGTHKLSRQDAMVSAKIESRRLFLILPNGERVIPETPLKSKTCGFCQRTYVRLEQLFTHLMSVHGKTHKEAKEITGLESKRNLMPGASGRTRRMLPEIP